MEELKRSKVTFSINYETRFGEQVFVVGDIPQLGNWKEGLPLKWTSVRVTSLSGPQLGGTD